MTVCVLQNVCERFFASSSFVAYFEHNSKFVAMCLRNLLAHFMCVLGCESTSSVFVASARRARTRLCVYAQRSGRIESSARALCDGDVCAFIMNMRATLRYKYIMCSECSQPTMTTARAIRCAHRSRHLKIIVERQLVQTH